MQINKELLEEIIYRSPLALLKIKDKNVIRQINSYLPYSVGMEFECYKKEGFLESNFTNIPYIMAVDTDSNEQRYRIPPGIKGLICLYNISIQLKLNSDIDMGSSVHYHTDMTHLWSKVSGKFIDEVNPFIIEKLTEWKTALDMTYAVRGSWYKFNDWKTLEVRIGEPTFDYSILVKRAIQCAEIVRHLQFLLNVEYHKIEPEILDGKDLLNYIRGCKFPKDNKLKELNAKLEELNNTEEEQPEEEEKSLKLEEIKKLMKNRNKQVR